MIRLFRTSTDVFPLAGGDGQQPHGVISPQQTGKLHQSHPGGPGARGG